MSVAAADLRPRLEALLGRDAVATEGMDDYAVDGLVPRAVVRPDDAEQVAAVLRLCDETGAAVIPWGGGTAVEVGNPPRAADVVLRSDRLSRIVDHDPSNLTVTVEAGITLEALAGALAAHRQFLPLDPPRAEAATAGGAVAVNLSGPRRMAYGAARDLVIGIRVAQAAGTVIRWGGKTVKNVAGYDMAKLFVGSLGTLGVITELTFKIAPLPEATATVVVEAAGDDPADLLALAGRIMASPLLPAAVTLANRAAAAVLGRGAAVLLVRAEGPEAATARHVRDLTAWAAEAGRRAEILGGEAEAAVWRAVRDFGWTGTDVAARLTVTAGAVGTVTERLGTMLPPDAGLVAHVPSGAVWISLAAEPAASRLAELRALVAEGGGHFLLARAPHALKTGADVWAPPPDGRALALMRGIKAAFDPHGVLNPGRFVAGL